MKNFMHKLLALVLVSAMAWGCSDDDDAVSKTFVLVHGAWQGPYVWQDVKNDLEKNGHRVVVVELPGHGDSDTAPATLSMDVYRDHVISALSDITGSVVLVGHSMGGVVVSAVAEKIPTRIEKLIFIGAFVPANGQSLLDLAGQDAESLLGPALIPSEDQLTLDVKHDAIVNIFCQDASTEKQQQVLSKFRVEPAIPFTNKIALTDAGFGAVDKYYIHTTQDHAIGTTLQNSMVKGAKITHEFSVTAGHSPFLSQPDKVAQLFMDIAR